MKRLLAFLLTALLLISLAGCQVAYVPSDDSTPPSTEETQAPPTQPAIVETQPTTDNIPMAEPETEQVDWAAIYLRTDGDTSVSYPGIHVIHNYDQLVDYFNVMYTRFSLSTPFEDSSMSFLDIITSYEQDYFQNNYLIFVLLEEPSGSIRHKVSNIEKTGDERLSISIDRLVPELGTDDMAQWHIILELSREKYEASFEDINLFIDGSAYDFEDPYPNQELFPDNDYTSYWADPEPPNYTTEIKADTLYISEIYSDYFIARSISSSMANRYEIKVYYPWPENFCVGDRIDCIYTNIYRDDEALLMEVDLVSYQAYIPHEVLKPVIYLYPEQETEVSVKLQLDGKLTCTYPAYNTGWKVTAAPDGTLTDAKGQTYNYLYWEGQTNTQWDLSKGFCVKGEDTAAFLEEALAKLGLNRKEANEFIVFWLPLMEQNPYNIIAFQTDVYTDYARLEVKPTPDTTIRVFMTWKAADSFVKLPEQELTAPDRNGFTVIEWGGTQLP